MKFSKADLDLIFKYIAERLYGDKLSSYPLVDKITGRELMPVVQDGDNKNMHSENLVNIPSMAAKFLQYDTLVASSREEMNRGFGSLNQKLEEKTAERQHLIETLEVTGMAISQVYGDSTTLGISQKTLTDNINLLVQEILSVTGKTLGIEMEIVPQYVISPTSGEIEITVTSNFGYMDSVEVYADNVLIGRSQNVTEFTTNHTMAADITIKAKAVILGHEYKQEKVVKKLFPYFIGAGEAYTDIMKPAYAIPYNGHLTGSFNVSVREGDRLFIIIPTYLRDSMVRTNIVGEVVASADMNGFEIPFDESTVGELTVFTSKNIYQAGIYNIDVTNNNN